MNDDRSENDADSEDSGYENSNGRDDADEDMGSGVVRVAAVDYSKNTVGDDLAKLTREDYDYRKSLLEPYEQQLRDLVDSNVIVDDAKERASKIQALGTAQVGRDMSRYGIQATGAGAQRQALATNLGQARSGTNMINNAYDAQDTLKYNVLGDGVAQGRRSLTNALGMMGDSAGMASNRMAAYNVARQNASATNWSNFAAGAGALAGYAGYAAI